MLGCFYDQLAGQLQFRTTVLNVIISIRVILSLRKHCCDRAEIMIISFHTSTEKVNILVGLQGWIMKNTYLLTVCCSKW